MSRSTRSPEPAPQVVRDAAELLLASGLRRTPARKAMIQVLLRASRAMSHADIEAALEMPLDRVTVYRSLASFIAAGLVQRQVGADRVSRFALRDGVDHDQHSHFHCQDCGHIFCLPQKPPRVEHLPAGFAVEASLLQFTGHCPDCRQSRTTPRERRPPQRP